VGIPVEVHLLGRQSQIQQLIDDFINGLEFSSGAYVEDVDVEATRDPKRRKLTHHASRRVTGQTAADQELIVSLSNELDHSISRA